MPKVLNNLVKTLQWEELTGQEGGVIKPSYFSLEVKLGEKGRREKK